MRRARAGSAGLAVALLASLLGTPGPASAAPAGGLEWEGQLRLRYEVRGPLDYRLPGTFARPETDRLDDRGDVALLRTRLGARLATAPGVRAFFQFQDSRVAGHGGSPHVATANLDLHQAYVDLDSLGGHPLQLRLGRQELLYGDQRLVSPLDWHNVGRAWDGARVRVRPGRVQVDGFATWIAEGRTAGQDRLFYGAYAAWRGADGLEADAYHFWRSFGDTGFVSEAGGRGPLDDRTAGARLSVVAGRLEARAEAALQYGRRAGDPVRAWGAAARVAAPLERSGRLKAAAEYLWASGDDDPADGERGRFDPLYPFAHHYLGYADLVGWANIRDLNGTLSVRPDSRWSAEASYHRFRLADASDAWVDASGAALRRDPTGAAGPDLGSELDLLVRWAPRSGVGVLAGYSRFWAGDFIARTGGGGDADWAFAQIAVSF